MGNTALKAIDNWCRCLTEDETLHYTEALGLKRNGGAFQKLKRLRNGSRATTSPKISNK